MRIKQIINRITDYLGGYERIRCPHCPLQMRFRGHSEATTKRLLAGMHEHIEHHRRPTFPGGGF